MFDRSLVVAASSGLLLACGPEPLRPVGLDTRPSVSDSEEFSSGTHVGGQGGMGGGSTEQIAQCGEESCACPPGFLWDGSRCADLDECALGIDACADKGGVCTNVVGEFACACTAGTFGDGLLCKQEPSCDPESCDNGGLCIEGRDGPRCFCPLGTTGPDCSDETTCALERTLVGTEASLVEDNALGNALRKRVGVPHGEPVRVGDLAGYYDLDIAPPTDEQVESLAGLECWTTLDRLSLPGHSVSDLSPIADLAVLTQLDLSCNPITTLAPLSGHVLLLKLALGGDDDCRPETPAKAGDVLGGMVSLKELVARGVDIPNWEFLSDLRSLRVLDLSGASMKKLPTFSAQGLLEELRLQNTALTTMPIVSDLPSLRRLDVTGNDQICDELGMAYENGLGSMVTVLDSCHR